MLTEIENKLAEVEKEKEKAYLKDAFMKLAINEGKCAFIDIHNEAVGEQQLNDYLKYIIVQRALEINLGKEKAMEYVSKMGVLFP
jgi:hypothetical protein